MQNDSISVNGVKFILKKKSLLQVKKGIETVSVLGPKSVILPGDAYWDLKVKDL